MKRTDSEVQQAVLSELKWDARVRETDVGVEVDTGIVTLTGIVENWAQRRAAQEAAHRVDGVLDVANDVKVRIAGSEGRTDTEIAGAVRHALEWDVLVPDARIRSTVSDGEVTLEGDVDSWGQREDAERAVANLSGVTALHNKIEIKHGRASRPNVRRAIEEALERHAHKEAAGITVEENEGRVVLTGVVHSLSEKQAVLEAARFTPGVWSVESQLRVAPD